MSEYDEINVDDIRLVSRTPKKTVAKPAAPAVPAPAVPAPEKEQDVDTVSLATRRRAEVGDQTVSFKEPPTGLAFAVDPDKKVESGNVPKIATIKKTAIANRVQDIFGISKTGSSDNPGTAAKPEAPAADKAVPELKKPVAHINPQAVAIPPSPALVMPPKAAESGKKDKKSKEKQIILIIAVIVVVGIIGIAIAATSLKKPENKVVQENISTNTEVPIEHQLSTGRSPSPPERNI